MLSSVDEALTILIRRVGLRVFWALGLSISVCLGKEPRERKYPLTLYRVTLCHSNSPTAVDAESRDNSLFMCLVWGRWCLRSLIGVKAGDS